MRLETIPLIAGGVVALFGLLLILDAWLPDHALVRRERRRRPRRERHRGGEAMIGIGLLGMAGAFLGLDVWRFRILAAIVGAVMLLLGIWKNRPYLGEILRNRGKSRRADPPLDRGPAAPDPNNPNPAPRERIR